jgi:hypothetical protein
VNIKLNRYESHGWLTTPNLHPTFDHSQSTHISKSNLSSILYYITGHGYGHAVRSSQVIRALKQARPDHQIHVRTTAPQRLFRETVRYSRQSIDVGIVQQDSLEMDLDATLQECRSMLNNAPRLVAQELAFIRDHDVRLVVGDIPALAFEIAAQASIPSVAITNFSWSNIYHSYVDEYPGFAPVIERMEEFYRNANFALMLPYPCNMDIFVRREPIPWIARFSPMQKIAARNFFSLPQSATVVLLSFGGLGLERLPWDKLKKIKDYVFVTTADRDVIDDNLLTVCDSQLHYEDLVQAVDIIVGKPGYGIVADAIANQVPFLYTDRGEFPEYPRLVQALDDCATAQFIPQVDLLSGQLEPWLRRLSVKRPNWPVVELNGAQLAAERILALMEQQTV